MVKKTFRVTIKLSGKNAPDLGMGAGIIGYQDMSFELENENKFEGDLFRLSLFQQAEEVAQNFVTAEIEEINDQTV